MPGVPVAGGLQEMERRQRLADQNGTLCTMADNIASSSQHRDQLKTAPTISAAATSDAALEVFTHGNVYVACNSGGN
jgi:hypothetical protein